VSPVEARNLRIRGETSRTEAAGTAGGMRESGDGSEEPFVAAAAFCAREVLGGAGFLTAKMGAGPAPDPTVARRAEEEPAGGAAAALDDEVTGEEAAVV
jgi:hypothetical protein